MMVDEIDFAAVIKIDTQMRLFVVAETRDLSLSIYIRAGEGGNISSKPGKARGEQSAVGSQVKLTNTSTNIGYRIGSKDSLLSDDE
jgi:hypothetical protein